MTNNLNFVNFKPTKNLKAFIKENKLKLKELIDQEDFTRLYHIALEYGDNKEINIMPDLTRLLYNINIDPLDYMDWVPASFLDSVKVEFDTSQITAADGYSVSDIKYEPDHVNVTGRAEELKKLKKISVPASALNMSGLTSKTEKVVDITDYLPEDISLTDENAGSVVVTVGIDKDGTKSYDISMGAIKVNNLANGLSLSYESADVLEIQIRGPGDILDQYKISDNVSIDLKNYQTAGTYTVPVTVGVPDGCVLESTVSVNVILEEK